MTWGSVNVYSMTASPLCSVGAWSHCAWRNTRAADTDVQRPGDHRSNLAPFYFYTFSHTSHIHHINWMSVEVSSFLPKSLCPGWCHIMHLAARSYLIYLFWFLSINRHCYLSRRGCGSPRGAAVISYSHASQHWYCCIDYDLNVCFLYGEL